MMPNLFGKKVVKQPDNPYVTGNPVIDAFVGRQDILRTVRNMLSSPHKNAITVFGQRRIGKTSVLKKLEQALNTSTTPSESTIRYVPIYFDLMEHTHQSLDEITKLLGEALCRKLQVNVPQWRAPSTQLLEWLVDLLQKDQEQALVILFDEFDSLDDTKSEHLRDEFFRYLKKLLAIDLKRLNIVFAIGRNIDDFKTAQAFFKGIDNRRVSLLDQKDTDHLIRLSEQLDPKDTEHLIHLSEQNESLYWSKAAIQRVWQLTNGHPYLTQLLCSLIWDHYWNQHPKVVPTVTVNDVEDSARQVLNHQQAGQNALEWLWSGLPPACRIDAAAFAELGAKLIFHQELIKQMYDAGIGTVIDELENAPKDLKEWDIIEGDAQSGYRFRVELLRQWIQINKPLRSIMQDELQRIRVGAEQYFQTAKDYHATGQFDDAIEQLESALRVNSHFIEAHKLLAKVLINKGDLLKAQEKLEKFHQSFPDQARPQLVELLWDRVESTNRRKDQLDLCQQILRLDPNHANAEKKRKLILQGNAEEFEDEQDYLQAIELYNQIGSDDSKRKVSELRRKIFWKQRGKWINGGVAFLIISLFFGLVFNYSQQWWGWSVIVGAVFGGITVFATDKLLSKRSQKNQKF